VAGGRGGVGDRGSVIAAPAPTTTATPSSHPAGREAGCERPSRHPLLQRPRSPASSPTSRRSPGTGCPSSSTTSRPHRPQDRSRHAAELAETPNIAGSRTRRATSRGSPPGGRPRGVSRSTAATTPHLPWLSVGAVASSRSPPTSRPQDGRDDRRLLGGRPREGPPTECRADRVYDAMKSHRQPDPGESGHELAGPRRDPDLPLPEATSTRWPGSVSVRSAGLCEPDGVETASRPSRAPERARARRGRGSGGGGAGGSGGGQGSRPRAARGSSGWAAWADRRNMTSSSTTTRS